MKQPATITAVEELVPGIIQLTIAVESPDFRFQAGQWVTLHLGSGVNRAYSIASAPQRPGVFQLAVRLMAGRGSEAVRALSAGNAIQLSGPSGDFVAPVGDDRPLALIGGNTGVAPIRSIALDLAARKDNRKKLLLLDGDGAPDLYVRDFRGLVSRENFYVERGNIEPLIERWASDLKGCRLMICGFAPFVERVHAALGTASVPIGDAIIETFD
jgi:ferredoxin-NADP reductase